MRSARPPKPTNADNTPVPADTVRMHREVAELTRAQAAEVLSLTERAWAAYEQGARPMPKWLLDRFAGVLTGAMDRDGNVFQKPATAPSQPSKGRMLVKTVHQRPEPKPMPTLPEFSYQPASKKQEKAMEALLLKPTIMTELAVRREQAKVMAEQEALRVAAEKRFGQPSQVH